MKIITLIKENRVNIIIGIVAFTSGFVVAWIILSFLTLDSAALFGLLGVIVGSMLALASNYLILERQRKDKLELIAYDKIVDTHQQAYAKWYEVTKYIYNEPERLKEAHKDMQDWLPYNCLYLDQEIEDALRDAVNCALYHQSFVNAGSDEIMNNWNDIHKPGNLIRIKIKLHPIPIPEDTKGKESTIDK